MHDLLVAVEYLHSLTPPIVHRDIKPENILCFGEGVKLGDFGSSNQKDYIQKGTMCGTPEYLSPEMIKKDGHNEKLDIWSLGVLAYELYFGKTPFSDLTPRYATFDSKDQIFDRLMENILVVSSLPD